MTTFEYRHDPALSQEFVNGGYELGEVKHITIDGHEILYRVGSAILDNSCCGSFGCGYGLVIGENMSETRTGEVAVSQVREISADEALAEAANKILQEREALNVVNFYTNPQRPESKT